MDTKKYEILRPEEMEAIQGGYDLDSQNEDIVIEDLDI